MEILIFSLYCIVTKFAFASDCDTIFESKHSGGNKRGMFHSPQFPQKYPPNIRCTYKFIGKENEKVVVRFEHFNIEGLLPGCDKDFLDIFIQQKAITESLIESISQGRFCGHKLEHVPNTVISLFNVVSLDFYSDNNTQRSYNQDDHMGLLGFNGTFTFVPNAPYFPGNAKQDVQRNCNFVIDSQYQKEGPITSPTYPGIYPSHLNCTYLLLGQSNERIQISFRDIDLNHQDDVCIDDFLLLIDGKSESSAVIGERFCGTRSNLKVFSTGNNILIKFVSDDFVRRNRFHNTHNPNSKMLQRRGFKFIYRFSTEFIKITAAISGHHIRGTDYGIEGRMATEDACHFLYDISDLLSGVINSPFYNRLYPANTTCQYELITNSSHVVRIFFEDFSLSDAGVTQQNYHWIRNTTCDGDMVNIEEMVPNKDLGSTDLVTVAKRCGNSVPGPIVSDTRAMGIKLTFYSDSAQSHSGFLANFDFLPKTEISKYDCGGLVTSKTGGGIISSQLYPRRYWKNVVCDWRLRVKRTTSRILIHFYDFVMEGSQQSCANAVLKIFNANEFEAASELCGTDSAIPAFISLSNSVGLKFISSQKSLGQKGFKLVWAEILQRSPDGTCPGFECLITKLCINKKLECDDVPHCGTYIQTQGTIEKAVVDDSDERQSCPVASSYNLLHVGLGIIITMLVLILLVVYVLYKEHRKQQNKSITTFVEDIPDGKLLNSNNVLHIGQLNPPLPLLYPQQYCHPLSDVISLPPHYNSGSSLSRPPSYLSQTIHNQHNNHRQSKDDIRKVVLRRAHSTKQLQQPNHDNHFKPLTDSYRNMSYLAKSQNCNLNNDHGVELMHCNESNFFPRSDNLDGGTWTMEKMQKISMV